MKAVVCPVWTEPSTSQTAKLDLCSGSSSCRPLPSSLTSVAHRRRCKTQFAAPASGKREYHPTRMAPCSVARYLSCTSTGSACFAIPTKPLPRLGSRLPPSGGTLTRIIVPAAPAEGQIASRSWEICERPQQHWKICEATQHQAIVDEGFPR